jgi:hypothetical protein
MICVVFGRFSASNEKFEENGSKTEDFRAGWF